jgi:RNA polymerase-binding transcription factor
MLHRNLKILEKLWRRPCSMDEAQVERYKAAPREGAGSADMGSTVTKEYRPTDDEPFMNERQLEYFRRKLLAWKQEILEESRTTIASLKQDTVSEPDLADRATSETDRALELRTRDRQRKLIAKIDDALRRIEDGSYGYCEETGEPISLSRLEARPVATLSLEAQERHERRERVHRDD